MVGTLVVPRPKSMIFSPPVELLLVEVEPGLGQRINKNVAGPRAEGLEDELVEFDMQIRTPRRIGYLT